MKDGACSVWREVAIEPGTFADYAAMKAFHYRGGRPGAVKRVFVAWYRGSGAGMHAGRGEARGMRAGVIVESLPALGCALRNVALCERYLGGDRGLVAARLNREMRTISRVVVHPVFRGVGLAVELVRHLLAHAETPCVEALAAMGRVHPFFVRAGMRAYDRPALPEAVRLAAALESEGRSPLELIGLRAAEVSGFLARELLRFSRRAGTVEAALAEARERLLSQPVYFLWTRAGAVAEGIHGDGHSVDRAGEAGGASEKRQRDAAGGDGEIAAAPGADGPL
jgi:N-acetylglutamate synthase-like GNAT family acetyltransferase